IPIAIVLVVVLETQRIRERERGGGRIEFACGLTRLVRFGLICVPYVVGYPSGQRGQTVNLLAMPSMVRIHHLPPPYFHKGNRGFSQIIQLFYPYPVFESLRFCAFTVSCVPVQSDARKSITSQSMPGAIAPSTCKTRALRSVAHSNRHRDKNLANKETVKFLPTRPCHVPVVGAGWQKFNSFRS